MAGSTVAIPRRMSALSGHFTASSLSDETDSRSGMNSLDPVTYPSEKPSSKTRKILAQDQEAIDHTFQKLFACMSIAYNDRAKLAAPQFKAYRGLRISVKEKMRLNNIVWREWYLQYSRKNKKREKICHFHPQMDDIHNKPTCVVLEGKYWKRSNEVVKNEYMKWRVFYKERMKYWNPDKDIVPDGELLDRVGRDDHQVINKFVSNQNIRAHYSPPELTKDDYKMDLTHDIFNTLQSVGFPHQTNRDLASLESSDLMQPELIGLESDLYLTDVDVMEPLQELELKDVKELLADSFNFDPETFRAISGHKRRVFSDCQPPAEHGSIPPPPAYPALKRSRSGPLRPPTTSCHTNNATESTNTDSNLFEKYLLDDLSSAVSTPPPPAYDFTQPSATNTPHGHLTTSVPSSQTSHCSSAGSGGVVFPPPVYPNSQTGSVGDAGLIESLESLVSSANLQFANRFEEQKPTFTMENHVSSQSVSCQMSSMQGQMPMSSNMAANALLSPGVSCVSHQTHNNVPFGAEGYSSAHGSVYASAGSLANSSHGGPSAACQQTNLATASRQQLNIASHPPLPQRGSSEMAADEDWPFKKPDVKPKVTQPSSDEKSSFLTQLLRKPLDKEAADAAITSHSSAPIHPVYFPTFTPISYTPQVTDGQDRFRKGQGGNSSKDNASSPSAEEDKKEAPNAERKRRMQIKTGFDALACLVPSISSTSNSKTSKATMLTKTLEYIEALQTEEKKMLKEMEVLNCEIAALDTSISQCHGQLPATGVPMVSKHKEHMKSILKSYVNEQTSKNWKFYVFSKLMEPLFDSFYNMVSTSNLEDLFRSSQAWVDQHGSLTALRPALLDSLRDICTETSILTDPSKFADQARQATHQPPELTSIVSRKGAVDQTTAIDLLTSSTHDQKPSPHLPPAQYDSDRSIRHTALPSSNQTLSTDMGPSNGYRTSGNAPPVGLAYRVPTEQAPPASHRQILNSGSQIRHFSSPANHRPS